MDVKGRNRGQNDLYSASSRKTRAETSRRTSVEAHRGSIVEIVLRSVSRGVLATAGD